MTARPFADQSDDSMGTPEKVGQTVTTGNDNSNQLGNGGRSERCGQNALQEQIDSLVKSLKERSQFNVWGNRFFSPRTIENIWDHSRLQSLVEAFYNEAQRRGDIQQSQRTARTAELVFFIENGNLDALAIILFCNGGYEALWQLDRSGHRIQGRLALKGGRLVKDGRLCIDSALPLSDEETDALGPQLGPIFFDNQWAFIPAVLQEYEHWIQIDPRRRLPIIQRKLIGSGSSGDVYKITVAPFCWQVKSSGECYPYPKARVLAQKVYRGETKQEMEEQRKREIDILDIHREASTHHDNILPLRGVLDHGEELSLLFDLADGSLQNLLDSKEGITMSWKVLMTSLARLGEALGFCHDGIPLNGRKIPVCHRDFRPDNVLIQNKNFMIGDFGMGKIIKLDEGGGAQYSKENGSTYSAPREVKGSSRDVWGFITTSIVAIINKIGGRDLVHEFSEARSQDAKSDKFWVREDDNVVINSGMTTWMDGKFQEELEDKYPKLASGIKGLLDYLVFTYLENLLHGDDSDDDLNAYGTPTALTIMKVLDDMAQWLPNLDSEEPPIPGLPPSFMTENVMEGAAKDATEAHSNHSRLESQQETSAVLKVASAPLSSIKYAQNGDGRSQCRSSNLSLSENTQAAISEVFSPPRSAAAASEPTLPTTVTSQIRAKVPGQRLPVSRTSSAIHQSLDGRTSTDQRFEWGLLSPLSNFPTTENPNPSRPNTAKDNRRSKLRSGFGKLLEGLQDFIKSPIRHTYPRSPGGWPPSTTSSTSSLRAVTR